ncbi:MAG: PQQ-binding-like beta-propeller repeat protein [Oscillospiraceae bacterium]
MNMQWAYPLPISRQNHPHQYESPMLIQDDMLFYIAVTDSAPSLHKISTADGSSTVTPLPVQTPALSSTCFFVPMDDGFFLYAGNSFIYRNNLLQQIKELEQCGKVMSHLVCGDLLLLTYQKKNSILICFDLRASSICWKMDISNTKPYFSGELSIFHDLVTCFGNDQLLFLQPYTGEITDSIKISRIDKLFCPIPLDDNRMLIGYTNWTNAGILCYERQSGKVLWRNKRRFEGPQLRCRIWMHCGKAFWVKNDTELIAIDCNDGSECYHLRTEQWLYTDLYFADDRILYGTSGADGQLCSIRETDGMLAWSVFMKNGCAYLDFHGDSVIAGDYDRRLMQIALSDGRIMQKMLLDGEIIGRIKVHQNAAYTVIWQNEEEPAKIIKMKI